MNFEESLGHSIYNPPPFKIEYFTYLRLAMENFISKLLVKTTSGLSINLSN